MLPAKRPERDNLARSFVSLACMFCLIQFTSVAQQPAAISSLHTRENITYQIIEAPGHTYGYNVLIDGHDQIHQPSIPALQGNKGFATMKKAAKVARLAIRKIKNGEMPPTISKKELIQLNAI